MTRNISKYLPLGIEFDTYLGQPWQINESQVENVRRVDFEVDGLPVDSLVGTSHSGRFVLDLSLYIAEIGEPAIRNMVEFSPFRLARSYWGSVRILNWVWISVILGDIDELQYQRSPRDDTATTRKEISADDIF